MTHGSLFSGIGGFDLSAEWMGWENIFHCEWNEFGQKVLKHYWPKAISYHDITTTDFTIHRGTIDILTGGFPCQPYSQAGKRLGKEDERHLWPEMLRAIREIQPGYVVGENVSGLVNWNGGMVFDKVQTDLEAAGYEVLPFLLPACGVNAPHRRERVWFIAYAQKANRKNALCTRGGWNGITGMGEPGDATNTNSAPTEHPIQTRGQEFTMCDKSNAPNTSSQGLEGRKQFRTPKQANRREQPSRPITKLHKISDWRNFPTQPPVCSRNDGLPERLDGITFSKWRQESIKAAGNAIVPQVAYQIFKAIEKLHHDTSIPFLTKI